MAAGQTQRDIDAQNAAFWNELCGSRAAQALGIAGNDRESLAKFDRFFFDTYPYLDRFVPFASLRGAQVLEVGLGYGSVSQRLAEHGAHLTALDIAAGPVAGVAHRLRRLSLPGGAVQGSILAAPFPDASFDYVVSIGCLHHTGDLPRAVAEIARLLRPGGRATLMSYNATSYWRWWSDPGRTCAYAWSVLFRDPPPLDVGSIYDVDTAGQPAPETVFVSKSHFARLLSPHFRRVHVGRANVRSQALRRPLLALLGPVAGLDLYAQVTR